MRILCVTPLLAECCVISQIATRSTSSRYYSAVSSKCVCKFCGTGEVINGGDCENPRIILLEKRQAALVEREGSRLGGYLAFGMTAELLG